MYIDKVVIVDLPKNWKTKYPLLIEEIEPFTTPSGKVFVSALLAEHEVCKTFYSREIGPDHEDDVDNHNAPVMDSNDFELYKMRQHFLIDVKAVKEKPIQDKGIEISLEQYAKEGNYVILLLKGLQLGLSVDQCISYLPESLSDYFKDQNEIVHDDWCKHLIDQHYVIDDEFLDFAKASIISNSKDKAIKPEHRSKIHKLLSSYELTRIGLGPTGELLLDSFTEQKDMVDALESAVVLSKLAKGDKSKAIDRTIAQYWTEFTINNKNIKDVEKYTDRFVFRKVHPQQIYHQVFDFQCTQLRLGNVSEKTKTRFLDSNFKFSINNLSWKSITDLAAIETLKKEMVSRIVPMFKKILNDRPRHEDHYTLKILAHLEDSLSVDDKKHILQTSTEHSIEWEYHSKLVLGESLDNPRMQGFQFLATLCNIDYDIAKWQLSVKNNYDIHTIDINNDHRSYVYEETMSIHPKYIKNLINVEPMDKLNSRMEHSVSVVADRWRALTFVGKQYPALLDEILTDPDFQNENMASHNLIDKIIRLTSRSVCGVEITHQQILQFESIRESIGLKTNVSDFADFIGSLIKKTKALELNEQINDGLQIQA